MSTQITPEPTPEEAEAIAGALAANGPDRASGWAEAALVEGVEAGPEA